MNSTNQPTANSVCEEYNYNTIFKKHSKEIFNFLMFKYGNKQFAEDAVQDSFITLWKNCNKIPLEKAVSYLYTVAKNRIIDLFRSENTAKKHAQHQGVTSEKRTPSFILEEKEFHIALNTVLAKMPEKYRVPFLLNRIEKKKYKEIALMLDTTVKSIEKRIYNALEFLQSELQIPKKRF